MSALACYGIHAAYHLYHGRPGDLLWVCHLGAAIIGIGLITSSMAISGIGTQFLCLGTPQWILYLAMGGEFMPTSIFTHVIALGIGLYSVRIFGMPKGVWWKTVLTLVALIILSRLTTPAASNINVAFVVQEGFETYFPSYPVYIALMVSMAAAYFCVVEYGMRRWWVRTGEKET